MSLSFAELDVDAVQSSVIAAYEKVAGVTLYPGDPVRLFLNSLAYVIAVQNGIIDMAGKANLVSYASGEHLDAIGEMVGTKRLGVSSATTVLRFSLQEALAFDVNIPSGTLASSADGGVVFSTTQAAVVAAGKTSVDVPAVATVSGSRANGLLPGQVSTAVSRVAYVSTVANVTETEGGADVETDDRLRARIREAPETFSCAGSAGSYRALAMAVSQEISDVSVTTPEPGTVDVRPVLSGGELPSEEILAAVRRALNADTVRPLTDTVVVKAPTTVSYAIDVTWYLPRESEPLLETVRSAVTEAVETYRVWQRSVPGRDILPTKLISLMEQAGARRVVVTSPAYTTVASTDIARESSVNVTFGGVEDE